MAEKYAADSAFDRALSETFEAATNYYKNLQLVQQSVPVSMVLRVAR